MYFCSRKAGRASFLRFSVKKYVGNLRDIEKVRSFAVRPSGEGRKENDEIMSRKRLKDRETGEGGSPPSMEYRDAGSQHWALFGKRKEEKKDKQRRV